MRQLTEGGIACPGDQTVVDPVGSSDVLYHAPPIRREHGRNLRLCDRISS